MKLSMRMIANRLYDMDIEVNIRGGGYIKI